VPDPGAAGRPVLPRIARWELAEQNRQPLIRGVRQSTGHPVATGIAAAAPSMASGRERCGRPLRVG